MVETVFLGSPAVRPEAGRRPMRTGLSYFVRTFGCQMNEHDSERIAERLGSLTSAKQACKDLLQDALDGGGSDNITIIVGRTIPPEE